MIRRVWSDEPVIDAIDIAERLSDLDAGEGLPHRAECRVVARALVPPAAVHAFGRIERDAACGSSHLPCQVGIAPLDLPDGAS